MFLGLRNFTSWVKLLKDWMSSRGYWSGETAATRSDKIAHLLKRDSIYQQFPCFCRYMQHVSEIRGVESIHQSVCLYSTTHCYAPTRHCRLLDDWPISFCSNQRSSQTFSDSSVLNIDYKAVKTSLTGWDDRWRQRSPRFDHKEREKNSEPSASRWDAAFNLDGSDDNSLVLGRKMKRLFSFFHCSFRDKEQLDRKQFTQISDKLLYLFLTGFAPRKDEQRHEIWYIDRRHLCGMKIWPWRALNRGGKKMVRLANWSSRRTMVKHDVFSNSRQQRKNKTHVK